MPILFQRNPLSCLSIVCALSLSIGVGTLLSGCNSTGRSGTCPPIGEVTEVQVVSGAAVNDKGILRAPLKITDPEKIQRLVAFVNARRQIVQPSFYTMPAPSLSVSFYDKIEFVAAFGNGANFFL